MAFKINISLKGKTYKLESENEFLVGKKIGETIKGDEIDNNLNGYELTITGTSDLSGIPGFKDLEGSGYHRRLLTFGKGMKDKRKGIRLRKTNRGEEISLKTHQINIIVNKEGEKKFDLLIDGGDSVEAKVEGKTDSTDESKDNNKKEKPKDEKPSEEKSQENIKEEENISSSSNGSDEKSSGSENNNSRSNNDETDESSRSLGDTDSVEDKPKTENTKDKPTEEPKEEKTE